MMKTIHRILMATVVGLLFLATIQIGIDINMYVRQKENFVAILAITASGVSQNLEDCLINKNLTLEVGLAAAIMELDSMQKPLNGLGYGLLEYNILWVRNSFIQDNPAAKIWYVSDTCRKISTSLSENNTISEADELFLLNLMNASNNFAATMYDETGNLIAEAFNSKHFNDSLAAYVTQIYTP
mgnify:FL=1